MWCVCHTTDTNALQQRTAIQVTDQGTRPLNSVGFASTSCVSMLLQIEVKTYGRCEFQWASRGSFPGPVMHSSGASRCQQVPAGAATNQYSHLDSRLQLASHTQVSFRELMASSMPLGPHALASAFCRNR